MDHGGCGGEFVVRMVNEWMTFDVSRWCVECVPALVSLGSQSAMAFAMSLPSWESSRNISNWMPSSGKYLSQTNVPSASNKKQWLIGRDFWNGRSFNCLYILNCVFNYAARCQKSQINRLFDADQMVQFAKWDPSFCPRNQSHNH